MIRQQKIVSILLLLFISFFSKSQIIKLKFVDDTNHVQYVQVYDSLKKHIYYADSLGILSLSVGDYVLTSSHVSYRGSRICLNNIYSDTTIIISLLKRNNLIPGVTVLSKRNHTQCKSLFEAGRLFRHSNTILNVSCKLKMGLLISDYTKNGSILKSIKFNLLNTKLNRRESFFIELKLYAVLDDLSLDTIPLNKIPIYLYSKTFKPINEIILNESIVLPDKGLFISFETPSFNSFDKKIISFPISSNANKCSIFIANNNITFWSPNILKESACRINSLKGKYENISFQISYCKK